MGTRPVPSVAANACALAASDRAPPAPHRPVVAASLPAPAPLSPIPITPRWLLPSRHIATPRPAPSHPACLPAPADFGRKVKIELGGLTGPQIDSKLAEAVETGEAMPRAPGQSLEKLVLPTVTD